MLRERERGRERCCWRVIITITISRRRSWEKGVKCKNGRFTEERESVERERERESE